jgi:hypothetical protein
MARWLTDAEKAKLDAGLLPVLSDTPRCGDEMELCIGWAPDQDTAGAMIMRHPGILQLFMMPGLERIARLAGAGQAALAIGDECVGAYIPVYDIFGEDSYTDLMVTAAAPMIGERVTNGANRSLVTWPSA